MLKKIITLMLLCLIAFGCLACTPPPDCFEYDKLKKGIEKIELIKCAESEEQSVWYPRNSEKGPNLYIPFKFENMEIVETLAEEKVDGFLRTYSEIRFLDAEEEMNLPEGWCVRLLYKDYFHVILLDVNFICLFYIDGRVSSRMGSRDIPENYRDILVNNFFETQI